MHTCYGKSSLLFSSSLLVMQVHDLGLKNQSIQWQT